MASLTIHLLGTFHVQRDGEPVMGFESDKVRGLLAYLAVEGERPLRRELLAGLLWPNMPERQARMNLRRALLNLRNSIGDREAAPPFLCISRTTIQVNPISDHFLDVYRFEQALQNQEDSPNFTSLQAAVTLYRGNFLAGFSLAGSAGFEEWLRLKRTQLRWQAWEVYHQLAIEAAANGRFEQALQHAQSQIALEPWQEASHRQMMRYLCFTQRRNDALVHYLDFRHSLEEELNISPEVKTEQLYRVIRDGTLPHPWKRSAKLAKR